MEKIRVLFLAASPDVSPLGLDKEHREITSKIRAAEYRESLEVISRWAVRPDDVQQALLEVRPHILHFSGHGTQSAQLVLLDVQGKPKPVSKSALVHLLGVLKDNLRLVVLNACYSTPQAEAITGVIDCAVGMNRAVGDAAAITFAAAFYRALGFGRSIQTAFDLGVSALMMEDIPEDSTPELVSRVGVDPARTILVQPDQQSAVTKQRIAELESSSTNDQSKSMPSAYESLDSILLAYSQTQLDIWENVWTNPDDPDRLIYYVPPHYAVVKSELRDGKMTDQRFAKRSSTVETTLCEADASLERIPGATEEETLVNLLRTSDRLCVSEGPGAGKSIFTRRLQAFLSSQSGRDAILDGQPGLAVRWEEWDGSWPDNFHESLARELEPYADNQMQSQKYAEAALSDGRVTLILDALDQVGNEEPIRHLSDFLAESKRRGWRLRVVMTGRPFAIEQRKSTLLRDPAWRFGSIEDFDARQQYQYLYGPEAPNAKIATQLDAWSRRTFQDTETRRLVPCADLSRTDEGEQKDEIASLRTLFPNYQDIADLIGNPAVLAMVRGLAEEGELVAFDRRGDLYAQTSYAMLRRASKKLGDAESIESTEAVLAALACEMMVRDPNTYRVDGAGLVTQLREHAARRISGGVTATQWRRVEALTGLTNRSLLYGASHDVLAWHHKGMMEFYCGLHLARNSQLGWCTTQTDSHGNSWPVCGDADIRRAAADPQWQWAFRFAIEMHEQVRDDQRLLASVSALFQPADSQTGHRRPTELMQRAWSLLEKLSPHEWPDSRQPVLLPGGQRIIENFRSQWQNLCEQTSDPSASVAHELLSRFKPCPPNSFITACGEGKNPYTFLMGTEGGTSEQGDDMPQHSVRVSPFEMLSTPVTRAQFALFDPNLKGERKRDLERYSPAQDCPVIFVCWYDAWCFARWLGANYRLPTEAEWEYACRAGTTTIYNFGNDEKMLNEYAWYGENWDKGSTHPVATKRPNAWGLYDMHGNVWEWCADWYDSGYDATSSKEYPQEDPLGPNSGSLRVDRGGCWGLSASFCRSTYRDGGTPELRGGYLGFRLALVSSSPDGLARC